MDSGVIIDFETTGLDNKSNKIIEIGLLEFAYSQGSHPSMTSIYSSLEDPGVAFDPKVSKITPEMVRGQQIDWGRVNSIISRAGIVIAHNATFDKGFYEARGPVEAALSQSKHWCCSMNDIDWAAKGFKTKALTYLAADHGFVNPFPHRAPFDCTTTFKLIGPYLEELIRRSYLKTVVIYVWGNTINVKDTLKASGYYWNPDKKVWAKKVKEDLLQSERDFLSREVYSGVQDIHQEEYVD